MSGIKYYTIHDGEELPDEFAVVENVGGEPEIRAWYSRNDQLTAENAKSVVLTLEPRFIDEYGEYANLPVFNAHGSIVGYVGGEVPESGNPCEFNRLGDEGFTFCASSTEVVRLKAENAKLRKLVQEALASHEKMCTQRGNCFGCQFFDTEWSRACPIVTVTRSARELGIEVDE